MVSLFCPKCGKEVEDLYDRLCKSCFVEKFKLIDYPLVVQIKTCPTCGSIFKDGRWISEEPEKILFLVVEEEVMIHEEAKSIELFISPVVLKDSTRVNFSVRAAVRGLTMEEDGELEVRLKKESCDRCSRISSGYYEGIIQIRAKERFPTSEELKKCESIAYEMTLQMEKKDRLAFISKVKSQREGIDIYLGSINAARQITKSIAEAFGTSYFESSKLVGQKAGRRLYRITFSIRLPKFTKGDVVSLDEKVIFINHFEKRVRGVDLSDGSKFVCNNNRMDDAVLLCNRNDAKKAVLCAAGDKEIQILDPDSYKTVTLKKPLFLKQSEGTDISIVKTKKGLFLIPENGPDAI
ncbi:MAG: 60S ribosomal export protein NMD3 [Halobacteriota archaeon]|nr:60S ribosomal export protein NMD3 [Halobacteriota archaeon]